jgi:hypothetical protein
MKITVISLFMCPGFTPLILYCGTARVIHPHNFMHNCPIGLVYPLYAVAICLKTVKKPLVPRRGSLVSPGVWICPEKNGYDFDKNSMFSQNTASCYYNSLQNN